MRTYLRAISLLPLMVSPAAADGFGEVVAGVMFPVEDEDYNDGVDESFKLGVRLGSLNEKFFGPEGSIDFTPFNLDAPDFPNVEYGMQRVRAQIGGRIGKPVGNNMRLFGRASAGLDFVHWSYHADLPLGIEVEDSGSDFGLALEVGGGLAIDIGGFAIGGQIGLPMAFHFDEEQSEEQPIDFEYTAIDIDLLATVAFKL